MDPLSAALIKFATDLIQDQVKKKVGDAASGKVDDWIKQGDNARRLLEAFQAADDCFAEKCDDDKLKQAIRSASLAALPSLEKIAASLPETLDDDLLSHALRQRFADDWRGQLSEAQLDRAASVYRDCLSVALAAKCDQLGIWTLLEVKAARRDIKEIPEAVAEELRRENLLASTLSALHSLPSPPADFTGREKELEQLISSPTTQHSSLISGLSGMGGVGKTALALVAAHKLAEKFPDAQIYLDLKGTTTSLSPREVMQFVIHAFDPQADLRQASDDEIAALYRTLLSDKRALVLFDNAADAAQVKPLIPPPSCALLVTSRKHFTLAGLQPIRLDVMSESEARDLLLKLCARIGAHAGEIAQLCGYLPLALEIAAGFIAEHADVAVETYAARLNERKGRRIGLLKKEDEPDLNVEAAFALSYDQLMEENRARWRALAVFSAPFDSSAVASVWEMEEQDAQEILSEFYRASIVEFDEEKQRYQLHDLLQEFASARITNEENYIIPMHHAMYYYEVVTKANALYIQGNVLDGLGLFDAEWRNIQRGHQWAAENADKNIAALYLSSEFATACYNILNLRLNPRQRIEWGEKALAASRKTNMKPQEGLHLGNLGAAYYDANEKRKAANCWEQALSIARAVGDRSLESAWLGDLGLVFEELGEISKAIKYHKLALAISRKIGDQRGIAEELGNLGTIYHRLGKLEKAIDHHSRALVISRQANDLQSESFHLANLGSASSELHQFNKAIEYYEQALDIAIKIADRSMEATVLYNLGTAHFHMGGIEKAIRHIEKALSIYEAIESPETEKKREFLAGLKRLESTLNE